MALNYVCIRLYACKNPHTIDITLRKIIFLGLVKFFLLVIQVVLFPIQKVNSAVVVIFKRQGVTVRSHTEKLCWEPLNTSYIMDGVNNLVVLQHILVVRRSARVPQLLGWGCRLCAAMTKLCVQGDISASNGTNKRSFRAVFHCKMIRKKMQCYGRWSCKGKETKALIFASGCCNCSLKTHDRNFPSLVVGNFW